ncbi:helix-turn-helix transcriptional regulator [Jatrophihabitans telluris]|uniref:Helix-turn-helix transcriptional regulator n=1 Tax=Jatrophihabitans telluris TaxID=2038343 RepID=A0ABY4QWM6_9ACTN|nr:helix-turn-helix transcriptional regulator [Jatrophihabitans telluris]UQX87920.1 helix-turn-helix transcriptional regulator [Jatrophihabitans telluris]
MFVPDQTLRRAVTLISAVNRCADQDEFARIALPGLADLIGCDVITYHGVGTDQLPPRQFRRPDAQAEFCRFVPLGHQLCLKLPLADGHVVTIVLTRSDQPFSDGEREVLSILRLPLRDALVRADLRPSIPGTEAGHAGRAALAGQAAACSEHNALSDRERRVLELAASGATTARIARELAISPRTVSKHLEHSYRKLQVSGRVAAVLAAGIGPEPGAGGSRDGATTRP